MMAIKLLFWDNYASMKMDNYASMTMDNYASMTMDSYASMTMDNYDIYRKPAEILERSNHYKDISTVIIVILNLMTKSIIFKFKEHADHFL